MTELETGLSKCAAEARESQRERVRDIKRPRDGEERGKWKLEAGFLPKSWLNLDMNTTEIQGWQRSWKTYFSISNLDQAKLEVQKMALLACIEDRLIIRVEPQLDLCADIGELMDGLEKEIRLKNPRLVAFFKWMKT